MMAMKAAVPRERAERVLEICGRLESLGDAMELTQLLRA